MMAFIFGFYLVWFVDELKEFDIVLQAVIVRMIFVSGLTWAYIRTDDTQISHLSSFAGDRIINSSTLNFLL